MYLSLCLDLSCLDVIKYYYLSLRPHLRVLVPPSCVHRDRRPDLTVSGAHSPRFVFVFESFYLFLSFVCLSCGKEVAARHPALACVMTAWEFGGIAASAVNPLASSPHARRSREISAAGGGSPKPAGGLPSSRVAASPGAPFAGDHATSPPLTQCPSARLWLKPAGLALTHVRWPPLSVPWQYVYTFTYIFIYSVVWIQQTVTSIF